MNHANEQEMPLVMGVLNVTPDSFSDGGRFMSGEDAVMHAASMIEDGADIIDVGGESTRPGSRPVSVSQEIDRVVPVIEAIKKRFDTCISIDTTKSQVAKEAVAVGASMINDVSMLRYGMDLARVAAQNDCDLVLMHSRGTPETMMQLTDYDDVCQEVCDDLMAASRIAQDAGVSVRRIWVDPGIGFAKTPEDNVALIARLSVLTQLGFPVMIGPSRKSFIGAMTGAPVMDRAGGTCAAITCSVLQGVRCVRVHDVRVAKQTVAMSYWFARQSRGESS